MITRFLIIDHRGESAILGCWTDNTQPIDRVIRTRDVEDEIIHDICALLYTDQLFLLPRDEL